MGFEELQDTRGNLALARQRPTMADLAPIADRAARALVLTEYLETTAKETLRRQKADIDAFAAYLAEVDIAAGDLLNDMSAWAGISFGLVAGFKRWLAQNGYSIGTVNVRLATIKRYVTLAAQSGYVDTGTLAMIRTVKGYRPKEGMNLDEQRAVARVGSKKAEARLISVAQSEVLKVQHNTRDRLLLCILIDHGFRCNEIAALKLASVNMDTRQITVYRRKVRSTEYERGLQDMSASVIEAMQDYLAEYTPDSFLFYGDVTKEGMQGSYGVRAINRRVGALGKQIGIPDLSPHDLRHFFAWYAAYRGIPINTLKDAGGWSSLDMPLRYIGRAKVENKGMV